jgi:hypothetical protein
MPFPNDQPGTSQSWYPAQVSVPGGDDIWRSAIDVWAAPNFIVQGTYLASYYANALLTTQFYNNSNAQGDGFVWVSNLSPGTWRLDYIPIKDPGGGVMTFDISYDNGTTYTTLGTYDCYAAAKSAQSTQSFTGITVPTYCAARLRVRVLSRNASILQVGLYYYQG